MNLSEAGDILRTKLVSDFSVLPLIFENTIDPDLTSHPTGFVYVQNRGMYAEQITLGVPNNRSFRDEGIFIMTASVPRYSGTGFVDSTAQTLRTLFKSEFFASTHLHIGDRIVCEGFVGGKDGLWFCVPVKIFFKVDRTE
jgi:hypothetical protein